MDLKTPLGNVWHLVRELVKDDIKDADDYRDWASDNEAFIAKILDYQRLDGMPAASALIKPFFHPEEPLIGVNYTPVAHNTLFRFPTGWTPTLRVCRGVVFNRRGTLVALPFPKFFNDREHVETTELADDLACHAAVKRDGHLGIIFRHKGHWLVTTRGSFVSNTSVIAQAMLDEAVAQNPKGWKHVPAKSTLLAEIIHPETKVIVDYGNAERFDLIGGYDTKAHLALDTVTLRKIGHWIGFDPVIGTPTTVGTLRQEVRRLDVHNHEGYVATLPDGTRVKFKYASYLSVMIGDKLTYPYVMRRLAEGDFETRIQDLDAEVQLRAHEMVEELAACFKQQNVDERVKMFFALLPEDQRTSENRRVCRQFAELPAT